jgi:acetyl-CoA synthetase
MDVLDKETYRKFYQESIDEPEQFWQREAQKFISWHKPFSKTLSGSFAEGSVSWFGDGELNACYNCLDRHLPAQQDKPAIIFESNNNTKDEIITYSELYLRVCRFANVLKNHDVQPGDTVGIYLPMIPDVVVAMLACARIGAVHMVVFGGFSAEALQVRLADCECKIVITADFGVREKKIIPLKENLDLALQNCPLVTTVLLISSSQAQGASSQAPELPSPQAPGASPQAPELTSSHAQEVTSSRDLFAGSMDLPLTLIPGRDVWYHEASLNASTDCPFTPIKANSPLFILHTSGSTGKPKGVVHAAGGYLVYVALSYYYIFDYKPDDVHWCTADVGWITGHSYLVYGPLLNGATTLLFEGVPNYPSFSRYFEVIDKYQVTVFYTSPTALRALRKEGDHYVTCTSRASLRLLGSVGEPINPEVWQWYYDVVGNGRCFIVNTWWQTETGGILLTPLKGVHDLSAAALGGKFFGVAAAIVDDDGNFITDATPGRLVITQPWPGMMQTIYKDHAKFLNNYLQVVPGKYLTGDGAHYDKDGNIWVTGRNDDVIKVSGHRLGTEELESCLVSHPRVAEAAVVGIPHEIKGETIFAFVTLKTDVIADEGLKAELVQYLRQKIGAIATIEHLQWTRGLPKTRSGKIMRRILRKIACKEFTDLGDISTLADPSVVADIIAGKGLG